MAKGGRRKVGASKRRPQGRQQRAQRPSARTRQPAAQQAPASSDDIKALREEAEANATEADKAAPTNEPRPDGMDLDGMWKMAKEARDLFKAQAARHGELASKLEAQREGLRKEREDVANRARELDSRASELEEDKKNADERTRQLGKRELAIRKREADADLGFEKKRDEMLSAYDDVIDERREALDAREGELREREDEVEAKARALSGKERQAQWDQDDIEEERSDLAARLEQLVSARHEEYEHQAAALRSQLKQARADRDKHATELARREDADRRSGQRSTEALIKELDASQAESDRLRGALAERPDASAAQRLDDLAREQQSWHAERLELTRQLSELKRRAAYADNDMGEREAHRDRIVSLVSQQELLHKANEELRTEVNELIADRGSQSPFPACIEMDQDSELQREGLTDRVDSLKELVAYVREDMASADDPLFYSEADVRSFIGGLAMGRLTLLQGISGTGKTSLPIAFARAVGTEASVIEVQAGWRDPQDLVGHYNTFEKRFHEKEFLKALYRAGTPRWRDSIQIVLLDEMNLSYPEQYFSDMLSALELRPDRQHLRLMTHAVASAPKRFKDGSRLPIPENVWFVGTANHDETTMNFADKTYDRAHVMEFPHRPDAFDAEPPGARHPVSADAFRQAVETAGKTHAAKAERLRSYIEENLRDRLARDFDIGWGPRLERQMLRYVPVVIAAGGTVSEAGDHLLAMRLLRKLKDRHNNRPEHLGKLKDTIEESWFDKKQQPTKSIRLLDKELARSGRDPDGEA